MGAGGGPLSLDNPCRRKSPQTRVAQPLRDWARGCKRRCRGRRAGVLADLLKLSAHGVTRAFWITALDGLKDSFVMKLAALTAAVVAENTHALFAKQPDDRIDQRQNERVGGRFSQCEMEIIIGVN